MCACKSQHDAEEIGWQSNSQWFRRGGRVGFADSVSKRLVEIRRGNHGVQEAEQGTAFDEVGSADGLHLTDGLHERLGGDAADAEEFFHVHATPGFGTGVRGALPDGVQIAGPFDGTTQAKTSAFQHFQDTGIIGTPANNSENDTKILPTTMPVVVGDPYVTLISANWGSVSTLCKRS